MSPLLGELNTRWRTMFRQLEAGGDLPPAQRLRAEGMMEALVLSGEQTAEKLQEQMDGVYRTVFGQSLEDSFGERWREFFPFPQIPAVARRAPVYPSTPV